MSGQTSPLRLVFFGTPEFSVPTLTALLGSRHLVAAVFTQPDRPKGRGQHLAAPPAKVVALAHAVPVLQPETLKDDRIAGVMTELRADLGVVVAYGKILPERLLTSTRLGFVNVHASLLPLYRGAAPINRAVLAGDAVTGVTIMRVVRELDAGPMLASASRPIGPDETSDSVERALAELGASLLMQVIEAIAEGAAHETTQDHRLATYAPRLTKGEGLIDWNAPAADIHNKVRGLHPWPHASTHFRGVRCTILRTAIPADGTLFSGPPGSIVEASGERLDVVAGDGRIVRIMELQPDGRRRMSARDFLSGHALGPGDRLGTGLEAG